MIAFKRTHKRFKHILSSRGSKVAKTVKVARNALYKQTGVYENNEY